jgi:hypothetical protein
MEMPYIVAAVFYDGRNQHALLQTVSAVDAANAAGKAVSSYYGNGGTLPLMSVNVMEIEEQTARAVVAVFDAKAAAEKAESDKVVGLHAVPMVTESPPNQQPQE